ncbi:hypothetical protein [Riemerella columbipharyngis]|uniref:Uncharacterized protein n=1 Tax=Riemerella columbipharyngis TaxID=1071918 RepID=A0A1G7ECE1_9FLAO|nr:hypothetical protein [Riemerella columbipharyngis]SDE61318.1 hypothetical protein SAMN05421544_11521 [Riemerella columbipharyngis]
MKTTKIALYTLCLGLVLACNKKQTVSEAISQNDTAEAKPWAGSLENVSSGDIPTEALDLSKKTPDKDETLFLENGKPVLIFNSEANAGLLSIDGKSYPLSQMNFSENNYELFGKGVKVSAENGDIAEKNGVLNSVFDEVTVEISGKVTKLHHIVVKDNPKY